MPQPFADPAPKVANAKSNGLRTEARWLIAKYCLLGLILFGDSRIPRANAQTLPTNSPEKSRETNLAAPKPAKRLETAASTPTIRKLADLEERKIKESSGLAISGRNPDVFWTHNDSGGDPELFAFNIQGKSVGKSKVKDAECRDWEDMGAFTLEQQHYLFIADTGDNIKNQARYSIYWGVEPELPGKPFKPRQILFRYEDGSHDCEAVAYDSSRREFLLVEKRLGLNSRVYSLSWDPRHDNRNELIANRIGALPVMMVTGGDISTDGLHLVVSTYANSYEITRNPGEDWAQALAKPGRSIATPSLRQGEAICYGRDNVTLYLTSEKHPCPLFSITRPISEN